MIDERAGVHDLLKIDRSATGPRMAQIQSWLPPIDRREFWAVQVLVVLVAAVHFGIEYWHVLDAHSPVYLLPTTLFLLPVLYAALNFGRRGAVLTALWAAILILPNLWLLHDPIEGVGEVSQVAWITVVAIFVGGRVERERSARRDAEYRAERQRDSEERYRAIVNSVGEPILLLDVDQRVIEANDAAAALFGRQGQQLRGSRLQAGDREAIQTLLDAEDGSGSAERVRLGQPPRWYEPIAVRGRDSQGSPTTQLLLVDVTESIEREQGLQGITRLTLTTREEEWRRISRELHDGPLQSLITLWRDLDAMSSLGADPQRERLLRARNRVEEVAGELRRFSRDLRPSVLDDLGLAAALRAERERMANEWQIDVRVGTIGTPRRLGTEAEITLLRIAQEALRNVARHSQGSVAMVSLKFGPPGVRLRIADDGVGLDPIPSQSELLGGGHLGMIGMRERARMIGGSVTLRPAALGGLEVTVDVPEASLPSGA